MCSLLQVRVSYFIKELYGAPEDYIDPWESPLARLIEHADTLLFLHPVVNRLIELKWHKFGFVLFCLKEIWMVTLLVLFMFEHTREAEAARTCNASVRASILVISVVNLCAQLLHTIKETLDRRFVRIRVWGDREVSVSRSVSNFWTLLRVLNWLTLMIIYASQVVYAPHHSLRLS